MPPKKRGRPAGSSSAAPQPPAKRVRVGETSIIGTQSSAEVTDSGRPRRTSAGDRNYNTKRAKAANAEQAGNEASASTAKIVKKYKKKGASKLFGKRRLSDTGKVDADTSETPKRGRGRPPKVVKYPSAAAVEDNAATTPKKAVGRPRKTAKRGVGRPKKIAEDANSAKAPAANRKGLRVTANHEDDGDEVDDSNTLPNGTSNDVEDEEEIESLDTGRQYWLMKAEPESRIENGVDVKFSIDDLRARGAGGEAWDGVRNYGARNNMRAMRKGDFAFFYHSSCKVPGIVGVMEIVGEHRTDGTVSFARTFRPYSTNKSR
jgi:hypothetical protein